MKKNSQQRANTMDSNGLKTYEEYLERYEKDLKAGISKPDAVDAINAEILSDGNLFIMSKKSTDMILENTVMKAVETMQRRVLNKTSNMPVEGSALLTLPWLPRKR